MRKGGVLIFSFLIALLFYQVTALDLTVYVNDSSSNVSSATVFVYNDSTNYSTTTNSSGYAVFNNLSADNYTINITKNGYYLNSSSIELLTNTTVNITLIEDAVAPVVTLNSPANNSNTSDTTPELNFTVTDDLDSNISCTLYLDGSSSTSTTASNNTESSFTPTVSSGIHNWTVSCVDDQNNEHNATAIYFYVDTSNPSATLTSPDDNTITNQENITFNWTASDSYSPTVSCGLYINSVLNTTIEGNDSFSTEVDLFSSGSYDYYVSCNDSSNNLVNSSSQTIYVDNNHNPTITLSLSDNNTQNNTAVTLSAALFSYSNITSANYTIGSTNGNLSLSSGTVLNGTWTASITLSDNSTNITVYVKDYYNDTNNAYINFTIDDTKPTTNVSSLTVTNTTFGSLNLSWTNDDANYKHRIYRSTSNFTENATEGTLLGTTIAGATNYEDNTTLDNTTYFYAVVSQDQADNYNISIYAEANGTATDSTKPKNPTSINTSLRSNNAIRLTWDAVTEDVTGREESGTITYYIFRSNSFSVNTSGTAQLSTTSTYVDDTYSGLSGDLNNNTYYYFIVAQDSSGNRNTSNSTYTNGTVGGSCSNSYSYDDWGSCSDGVESRTGTRYCYGLNIDDDIEEDDQTRVCSSTSSNSGDDSSTGDDDNTEVSNLLASWTEVTVKEYDYSIPKNDFGIKKIIWTPKEAAQSANIKLIAHSSKPTTVSDIESTVFKFFEINAFGFDLDNAIVEFFVEDSWLSSNKLDKEEITLWHYDDGWKQEISKYTRTEDGKLYFEATIASFSVFAIGSKELVVTATSQPVDDEIPTTTNTDQNNVNNNANNQQDNSQAELTNESDDETEKDFPVLAVIILSIIILLSGITYYFMNVNPILGKKLWLKMQELYYRVWHLKIPKKLSEDEKKLEETQKKMDEANKQMKAKMKAEKDAEVPENEEEALKKYEKRDRTLRF